MGRKIILGHSAAELSRQQLQAAQELLSSGQIGSLQRAETALEGLTYASLPGIAGVSSAANQSLQNIQCFEEALTQYCQTIERFDAGAANSIKKLSIELMHAEYSGWSADYGKVIPQTIEKLASRGIVVTQRDLMLTLMKSNASSMDKHLQKNVTKYSATFTTLRATDVLDPSTGVSLAEFGAWLLALIAADGPFPVGDAIALIGLIVLGLLLLLEIVKIVDGFLVAGNTQPDEIAPPSGTIITPSIAAASVDNLPQQQREHIMQEKHNWATITSGGPEDPDDWWEQIKAIIKQVLTEGAETVYKTDKTGITYMKVMEIAGEIVTVTYRIIDEIIHIGDAWVG